MEDGDEEALGLWRRFREFTITSLGRTYDRLNIEFDVYGGESTVAKESMDAAVDNLREKNLLVEEKGSLLVDLTKYKLDKGIVRKGGEAAAGDDP